MQIELEFSEDQECTISTTITETTSYGTPSPIESAHVVKSISNECTVSWIHDAPIKEIEHFIVSLREILKLCFSTAPLVPMKWKWLQFILELCC